MSLKEDTSKSIYWIVLLSILLGAAVVNLIGVFGPELGFDALWYHLTIAKIYLNTGHIFHIPGGLLYYSAMPRLAELMFIPLLKVFSDTGPHLLTWGAGGGTAICTYLIARKYLDRQKSLLAVVIFYVTPLVGWLSGSAYIDLIRTFWETLAILMILNKRFWLAGLVLGLALSTKTLAMGTIPIALTLVYLTTKNLSKTVQTGLLAVFVGLPWYVLSFLNTGYPFYPIAAGLLDSRHSALPQILQPLSIFGDYWKVFLAPEDLISPIFVIIIPFALVRIRALWSKYLPLLVYFALSYAVWWIIPRLGGGRFLLPYLPIWSVLTAIVISLHSKRTAKILISCVVVVALFNLVYRFGAIYKLRNYLMGKETRVQYLCQNLNFNLGVFVDCDGYFSQNIKSTDTVLLKGVHNLYYVNFPFVHESWYRGQKINYTLIQGAQKAKKTDGKLIYQNNLTKVRLYKLP